MHLVLSMKLKSHVLYNIYYIPNRSHFMIYPDFSYRFRESCTLHHPIHMHIHILIYTYTYINLRIYWLESYNSTRKTSNLFHVYVCLSG